MTVSTSFDDKVVTRIIGQAHYLARLALKQTTNRNEPYIDSSKQNKDKAT